VTGIVLMIGTLLLAFWLGSAAFGPDAYNFASSLLGSWIGLLVLLGWTFCLWFHLLNGVRHLFWDCGLGFSLKIAVPSGYLVLLATCGLTVLTWAPWVYSKLIA
jgi:succinate dehydrogenase / fumarate reductase cytochrome b subunit